jgi:hypothetical protein
MKTKCCSAPAGGVAVGRGDGLGPGCTVDVGCGTGPGPDEDAPEPPPHAAVHKRKDAISTNLTDVAAAVSSAVSLIMCRLFLSHRAPFAFRAMRQERASLRCEERPHEIHQNLPRLKRVDLPSAQTRAE